MSSAEDFYTVSQHVEGCYAGLTGKECDCPDPRVYVAVDVLQGDEFREAFDKALKDLRIAKGASWTSQDPDEFRYALTAALMMERLGVGAVLGAPSRLPSMEED